MHTPVFQPQQWTGPGWTVWAANPAAGVLHTRATGVADVHTVERLMEVYDTLEKAAPRLDVFHDWAAMTGYSPEARVKYTAWSKGHRHSVGSINILVQSPLVAMGISVANVVLGGYLKSFSNRAEFEAAMERALRARQ